MVTFTVFFFQFLNKDHQEGKSAIPKSPWYWAWEPALFLSQCTEKKGLFARNDFCSSKNFTRSKKLTSQHKALLTKPLPVTLQWALKTHHRTIDLQRYPSKSSMSVCTKK